MNNKHIVKPTGNYGRTVLSAVFLILFFALTYGISMTTDMRDFVLPFLNNTGAWGRISFVLALIGAVVFTPLTAMPIIPIASLVFGPFQAGVLSVIGWTIGSLFAFIIARGVGQHLVTRFISLERIWKIERHVPKDKYFWSIVLLRLILPMDIVSYGIGTLTKVPFKTYALATFVGSIPFSFIFAYVGDAIVHHDYYDVAVAGSIGLAVFVVAYYWKMYVVYGNESENNNHS